MNRMNLVWKTGAGLLVVLCLSQCGKGASDSSKVDVENFPDNPIVITSDTTVRGNAVKGAYFKFGMGMTNDSDKKMRVVALAVKVFAPGSMAPIEKTFDPASALVETGDTCKYDSYGTWAPGQKTVFKLAQTDNATCSSSIMFIVEGIPTTPNQGSFRYRVVVRPLGFFLDGNDVEAARLTKSYTFYTR